MAMMYDRHLSLVTRNGHIPLVQTLEEHGNAGKVKENMDGTGVQCLTPVQGVVPAQGSVHCTLPDPCVTLATCFGLLYLEIVIATHTKD